MKKLKGVTLEKLKSVEEVVKESPHRAKTCRIVCPFEAFTEHGPITVDGVFKESLLGHHRDEPQQYIFFPDHVFVDAGQIKWEELNNRTMPSEDTKWFTTGCIDCGKQIRHPDFRQKDYPYMFQKCFSDYKMEVIYDTSKKHYLILLRIGDPVDEVMFYSCMTIDSGVPTVAVEESLIKWAKGV